MGAPKLKWTAEEEAALKAGIKKYGLGKWSTILKDPEFSEVLRSRSNVDLKDKWRNLNCMASGMGSRQRSRVSVRINLPSAKQGEEADVKVGKENDSEVPDVEPAAVAMEIDQSAYSKRQITRLDDVVLEAIRKLKEPRGSNRIAIAEYIEEFYTAPPNLEKNLTYSLKVLTENGLLVKVKNLYRIAPKPTSFTADKEPAELNIFMLLTKEQIDAELEMMKNMTAEEANAAAARAVMDAEIAIAAAEAATREAEAAEAEAEEARCFLEARKSQYPTIFV